MFICFVFVMDTISHTNNMQFIYDSTMVPRVALSPHCSSASIDLPRVLRVTQPCIGSLTIPTTFLEPVLVNYEEFVYGLGCLHERAIMCAATQCKRVQYKRCALSVGDHRARSCLVLRASELCSLQYEKKKQSIGNFDGKHRSHSEFAGSGSKGINAVAPVVDLFVYSKHTRFDVLACSTETQ